MIGEFFITNRKSFMGEVQKQTNDSDSIYYVKVKIPSYQEIDCFDEHEVLLCVGKTESRSDYVYYSFSKNKKGWLRSYEVRLITDPKIKFDL